MQTNYTKQFTTQFQDKSEFTLLVYFKEGYTKGFKFHSFKHDKRLLYGEQITDHRYSFNRLLSMLGDRLKDTYKTAIIYHNPTKTPLVKYSYGVLQDVKPLLFIVDKDNKEVKIDCSQFYTALQVPIDKMLQQVAIKNTPVIHSITKK